MLKELRIISYLMILFFSSSLIAAQIGEPVQKQTSGISVKAEFKNKQLVVTNTSNKPINLNDTTIKFHYLGKVFSAALNQKEVKLNLLTTDAKAVEEEDNLYNLTIQEELLLAPNESLQFMLVTDNKDTPHGFQVTKESKDALAIATGTLKLTLQSTPLEGLRNPVITVEGSGVTRIRRVTWGTTWEVIKLPPGDYKVSATAVHNRIQFYEFKPITVTINASQVISKELFFEQAPTTPVKVTLTNAPIARPLITLTGAKYTIPKYVYNNTIMNLPADIYKVTSDISGYSVSYTPNPFTVPQATTLNIVYTAINQNAGRNITFVNQCPFPVWFGFISGATPNPPGGSCNSDADCQAGSTCVNRGAGGNQCFWKNPAPADNNFRLAANGGTNVVQLPRYQNNLGAIWSGAIAGRTNCTSAGCETANCGGGTGACPAGRGFEQPATQAEITMGINSPDFYDVEVINGMNIPVQMSPVLSGPAPANPYECGSPGAVTSSNSMGACSWAMNPPVVENNYVRAGGNACSSNNDCQAPNVCGLSFNPGKNPLLQKTCGTRIGYWTANQVCGMQNSYGTPFNCREVLPPPQQNLTLTNLYQCTQVGSCYQDGAASTCCGCANWDQLGIPVPNATYTKQCVNQNPTWLSKVLPTLQWLKQACPSVYTYPYDDMSSTFICRINNSSNINSVNYTVTFCPGGKTGGVTGS
ncbi:thaumatin family protein [Legionella gresilensis]|uniref:thaumatin family protein n=1 Tax=Legionella gresilensis TaxID=91823 RepID=UPI0013EFA075|nr:thaumatin family protein [Legionella gresilensis]